MQPVMTCGYLKDSCMTRIGSFARMRSALDGLRCCLFWGKPPGLCRAVTSCLLEGDLSRISDKV